MTPSEQELAEWIEEINILCSIAETHGVLSIETRMLMDRLQAYLSKPADTPPLPEGMEGKFRVRHIPSSVMQQSDVYRLENNYDVTLNVSHHSAELLHCIAYALNAVYGKGEQ